MSRTILITILGEPVAQGRPRMSTINGHARAYDPKKSRTWKYFAAMIAGNEMNGSAPMEGDLSLSVRVFRKIPKSFSKRKIQAAKDGTIRPSTRPDLDNYVKGALDAVNGIVMKDDSQVVAFHEPFGKWYSDRPRIEIEVKELEP